MSTRIVYDVPELSPGQCARAVLEINYNDATGVTCDYVRDTIVLAGVTLKPDQFQFGAVTDYRSTFRDRIGVDGTLGMNRSPNSWLSTAASVGDLVGSGCFVADLRQGGSGSFTFISSVSLELLGIFGIKPSITWLPVQQSPSGEKRDWLIPALPPGTLVLPDTGTTFIELPASNFSDYLSSIPGGDYQPVDIPGNSNFYSVGCRVELPSVTYQFDGVEVEVPGDNLRGNVVVPGDSPRCTLLVVATPAGRSFQLLGTPILIQSLWVFDLKKSRIGIAKRRGS